MRGEEIKLDESVSDTEDPENDSDSTLEISISVPNLSDIVAGNVSSTARPLVQRSISDTHVSRDKERIDFLTHFRIILVIISRSLFCFQQERRRKFLENLEKRAKKRQKLMSMKRYSGLLKRPEILETVYSVESEDGAEAGKADKAEEDTTNTSNRTSNTNIKASVDQEVGAGD